LKKKAGIMGNRSADYQEWLIGRLKNPKEMADYINAALEDGDPKILLAVLKDCVEAMGGVSWLSRETHMTRAAIYKILSAEGNPKYDSLLKVLNLLGLRLNVEPAPARHDGKLVYRPGVAKTVLAAREKRAAYRKKR
jgi:probable addiction module antidote protein